MNINKTYLESILENTKLAKEQWVKLKEENKDFDDFEKKFHLRPTKSGVTIVSTLQEKPMRGKKVGKTTVKKWLEELYTLVTSNKNQEEKLQILTQLGFKERKKSSNQKIEEAYQAKMISEMVDNKSLKEFLEVEEIVFIASEFIIHDQKDTSDRERIDIVAFDCNNKLFFFELKIPNSKDDAIKQLNKYIKKYGEEKKQEMLEVLKEYPIHSVPKDNIEIEGYTIYGYGEKVNISESKKADKKDRVGIIRFG